MSFVVEGGSGNSLATSYVSAEEADSILSVNIHATDWAALPDETKERLLMWASAFLDWRTRWRGQRQVAQSGLCWPRLGVIDRDGYQVPGYTIPRALRVATAEMARAQIERDRSADQERDGLESIRVDLLALSFVTDYRMPAVPEHVGRILTGLGRIEGGGVNFKPIAA